MTDAPIRLGLIGAGRRGRAVIEAARMLDAVRLVRVASGAPDVAALVPPGCQVVRDWRAMLSPTVLDGVIVATPPASHFDMVREALASGLPVLVERPLTMDEGEVGNLKQMAGMASGLVMVDHGALRHPAFRAIKELAPAVGPIRAIRAYHGDPGPRPNLPALWHLGAEDLAMCLDLLRAEPEFTSVAAVERRETPTGAGETLDIRFVFPDEVDVRIRLSNLLARRQRYFAVHFDTLAMVFDDTARPALTLHPPIANHGFPEDAGQPVELPDENPLAGMLMGFAVAVGAGLDEPDGLELGADVVSLLTRCQAILDEKTA